MWFCLFVCCYAAQFSSTNNTNIFLWKTSCFGKSFWFFIILLFIEKYFFLTVRKFFSQNRNNKLLEMNHKFHFFPLQYLRLRFVQCFTNFLLHSFNAINKLLWKQITNLSWRCCCFIFFFLWLPYFLLFIFYFFA